jgi:D-serine deaminase-like pyridoxal phosphate-dependent protein
MNSLYAIADPSTIFTPALLFYKDVIAANIRRVLEIAGSPDRLRPHAKTHKTREIARLLLDAGVTRHKCATLAEAEMLADAGAPDVLIAYPMVGPNVGRLVALTKKFPRTRFLSLVDHPAAARALGDATERAGLRHDVLLDLDVGQHRTGVTPGPAARELYADLARHPGLRPSGFQVYDGHNHQPDRAAREAAVRDLLGPVLDLRAALEKQGCPVPTLVCGGTPTFPVFAALDVPGVECSPGTFVLDDWNTDRNFPDLTGFAPAALLLTRVVSKPTPTRLTLDLGYKAVASDPPAGKRCKLLDVPDAEAVLQNEEHLVVETPAAERFAPGDVVYAVPAHVCPTCALHREALVVAGGRVVDRWAIASRDRFQSV